MGHPELVVPNLLHAKADEGVLVHPHHVVQHSHRARLGQERTHGLVGHGDLGLVDRVKVEEEFAGQWGP